MPLALLDRFFGARSGRGLREAYAAWAASEAMDPAETSFVPDRCATALMSFLDRPDAPVLDYGCGAGASGIALHDAGAELIDGADLSAERLAEAGRTGIYRDLTQVEPSNLPDFGSRDYAAFTAIGSLGSAAAPLGMVGHIMDWLDPGGLFCFDFNDLALKIGRSETVLHEYLDTGAAQLLFREHGPALPDQSLGSTVYVLRKT